MPVVHTAPHTGGRHKGRSRAAPAYTLPLGEEIGKPGFPISRREGCSLPTLPAGGGTETRFPHTPLGERLFI